MMPPVKVAITAAAGQIGYALVYRIASGELFGDRPVELRLLDEPQAVPALDGVAMELADCAFTALAGVEVGADPDAIFDGANLALLVGSLPRKADLARRDLLAGSGEIFAAHGRALARSAASDLRVVVAGPAANTDALITLRNADQVPASRFSALTRLDHDRARALLAKKTRRPVSDVTRLTIWGNHSATQYADAFNAQICGRPAAQWIADDAWIAFDFIPRVAKRGAAVLSARGSASAASAASAMIEHVRDWFAGTPTGDWTSMAVLSDGSYGIPAGLVPSFPVTTSGGTHQIVPGLELSAFARAKIDASIAELQAEAHMVRELGFVHETAG